MSDMLITIKLPETLVERAKAAGVGLDAQVEAQTEQLIARLEEEIKRAEAVKSLIQLMDKVDSLPDDLKPTPEEIEAEIRSVRAGRLDWEQQPWTEDEIHDLMTPHPQSGTQIAAWLTANPPTDPDWGGIANDADVADHIHRMRREEHSNWDQGKN